MEDVDKIVISSLDRIGCDVDNVDSLAEFTTELLVQGCAKCLNIIEGTNVYSTVLPNEMSSRFRFCSTLAKACQDLGYKGDIGYHMFLYVNEKETRKLFLWLIEVLPNDVPEKSTSVTLDAESGSENRELALQKNVETHLKQKWSIEYSNNLNAINSNTEHWFYPNHCNSDLVNVEILTTPTSGAVNQSQLPFIALQTKVHQNLSLSILEAESLQMINEEQNEKILSSSSHNLLKSKAKDWEDRCNLIINKKVKTGEKDVINLSKILNMISEKTGNNNNQGKRSRFMNVEHMVYKQNNENNETNKPNDETRIELEQKLSSLLEKIQTALNNISEKEGNMQQLDDEKQDMELMVTKNEDYYKSKKMAIKASEEEVREMAGYISDLKKNIKEFHEEWELVRKELQEELDFVKSQYTQQSNKAKEKIDAIIEMRKEGRNFEKDLETKMKLKEKLKEEIAQLPTGINRTAYTTRILEMINSIHKLQEIIDGVLFDTRNLQKELSRTESSLDRIYKLSDERIYQYASTSQDSTAKMSYKQLTSIHQNCESILSKVKKINTLEKDIGELENNVDNKKQNSSQNVEEILRDYKAIKAENQALKAALQSPL